MGFMLVDTVSAPTVVQATKDVAKVIADAMGVITGQHILLAMFGMSLIYVAFRLWKRSLFANF